MSRHLNGNRSKQISVVGRLLVNFIKNRYTEQIPLIYISFLWNKLSLPLQFRSHLNIFHYSLMITIRAIRQTGYSLP